MTTTTMLRSRAAIRHRTSRPLTLPAAIALAFLALGSAPSRADLATTCGQLDELITCDATDVGKECQGGGTCHPMSCSDGPGSTQMTIYLCYACPTIVSAPDAGACLPVGSACGGADGGATCGVVNTVCLSPSATNKYLCQIPPASQPTGAPAGENHASSGGGCDVAPKPPKPGTIGLGLLGLGVVLFALDKARRRSR
jgi:hypothetical protein